jgi:hypothetical protein
MEDITLSSMLFSRSLSSTPYSQSVAVVLPALKDWNFALRLHRVLYDYQNKQALLSAIELIIFSLKQKFSKNYDMETISLNSVAVKISFDGVAAFMFF